MAKRRLAVMAVFVCLCFLFSPCYAMAASTADASEPINVNHACTLTLSYTCDGTAFEDVSVKLYKIADVSSDFRYTLTSCFESSGLILDGIQTVEEWNGIRSTLQSRVVADGIKPYRTGVTNANGQVCFESLTTGLYLAQVGRVTQGDIRCLFDAALIALPSMGAHGSWQYQVSAACKAQMLPPSESDKEIQLRVVKLWKGDDGRSDRPQSVEVELFRDGKSYQTIHLTSEENWSYRWTTKDDGAIWTAVERNIPNGYAMTVEQRGTTFVLTNTLLPNRPPLSDDSGESPQTGDTANVLLYIILSNMCGILMIIIGITGKRRRV